MKKKITTPKSRSIDLALQGGGAHGAYTWGVLDRLLETELKFDGISGTSAGAMNGAVLVAGYTKGGAAQARADLAKFWRAVADLGELVSPMRQQAWESAAQGWNLDHSLGFRWFEGVSQLLSPYEWNPLNINPFRALIESHIDFDAIKHSTIKLFVTATHVQNGQPRVFKPSELSIDALLAAACLPTFYQAVEIDGQAYWDGGYMGNPALWPLIYHTRADDVLLVQINPLFRAEVPRRAFEISNRLNEISFNSSLIAEMRAIYFVQELIDAGKLKSNQYKSIRMHMIEAADAMVTLDASSKLNTDWNFLQHLHRIGYNAAEAWLKKNHDAIGKKSTLDIQKTFLQG